MLEPGSKQEVSTSLKSVEAKLDLKRERVKSGHKFEMKLRFGKNHGGRVDYYFTTKDHDIKFGAVFVSDAVGL